jgi:hypothetical protein
MITVKQLREALEEHPDDMEVIVELYEECQDARIVRIYVDDMDDTDDLPRVSIVADTAGEFEEDWDVRYSLNIAFNANCPGFDGMSPQPLVDAMKFCIARGFVVQRPDGVFVLTAKGGLENSKYTPALEDYGLCDACKNKQSS